MYMCVENDEYELPVAVADTERELSRITNISYSTIHSLLKGHSSGKILGLKVVEVEDN